MVPYSFCWAPAAANAVEFLAQSSIGRHGYPSTISVPALLAAPPPAASARPHWPPRCSSRPPSMFMPPRLCTGCVLWLKCFPPTHWHGWLPHRPQRSVEGPSLTTLPELHSLWFLYPSYFNLSFFFGITVISHIISMFICLVSVSTLPPRM